MSSRLDRRNDWEELAALCNYRVEEMARVCNVSERQLQRFFLLHFGRAPKHWLDEVRAKIAAQEIARGDLMKSVSNDLKFKDPASFTRFFKRVQGTTPNNFGRKNSECPKRTRNVAKRQQMSDLDKRLRL